MAFGNFKNPCIINTKRNCRPVKQCNKQTNELEIKLQFFGKNNLHALWQQEISDRSKKSTTERTIKTSNITIRENMNACDKNKCADWSSYETKIPMNEKIYNWICNIIKPHYRSVEQWNKRTNVHVKHFSLF